MDRTDVERWLVAYRGAWETDDPQAIAALFTEDAVYAPRPFGSA